MLFGWLHQTKPAQEPNSVVSEGTLVITDETFFEQYRSDIGQHYLAWNFKQVFMMVIGW